MYVYSFISSFLIFFFNDTATTEIYTLSLHDALPISFRALLEVPQRLASRAAGGRVLIVLDEFGEVLNVPGEPDALMRSAFQASPDVSFLFMGSKRSLMDGQIGRASCRERV